jgi:hypothetical protein
MKCARRGIVAAVDLRAAAAFDEEILQGTLRRPEVDGYLET